MRRCTRCDLFSIFKLKESREYVVRFLKSREVRAVESSTGQCFVGEPTTVTDIDEWYKNLQ